MTTAAELILDEPIRLAEPRLDEPEGRSRRLRSQFLPGTAALLVAVLDVCLVAGAFMLAYVARFSPDEAVPTLSLDHYVRVALLGGLFTSVLLATHGLYVFERPQSWPLRLRGIVSSNATALVLAVTTSYFLG